MSKYESIKALHSSLPPFQPLVSVALLPYLALVLLASTFALAFYSSTLPKNHNTRERDPTCYHSQRARWFWSRGTLLHSGSLRVAFGCDSAVVLSSRFWNPSR
ncbi:hypothetical protein BDP27DRAFT_1444563 [Rhodocollybia butyracea]|uniref:Dolichyl-diphosphooligosaccharide-protein glycosyltransferase subunit OST5 n=1 Tax=Rhodocollybia butyracea TaxID=206335 RepID=A0A9P5UBC6_9AGAR|nr:hypothetical protein BDP27DRAFT_1444563 [Rhodocollybia butyracea]